MDFAMDGSGFFPGSIRWAPKQSGEVGASVFTSRSDWQSRLTEGFPHTAVSTGQRRGDDSGRRCRSANKRSNPRLQLRPGEQSQKWARRQNPMDKADVAKDTPCPASTTDSLQQLLWLEQ